MDIEIIKILGIFSILQIAVWVFFLINYKKANTDQRLFLIKLTLIFAFFISGIIFLVFGKTGFSHKVANISNTLILLILPFIYFFILKCINAPKNKSAWLHYLPFYLILSFTVGYLNFSEHEYLIYDSYSKILIGIFYLQFITYVHLLYKKTSFKFLKRDANDAFIQWLKPFLFGFGIIMALKICILVSWNLLRHLDLCVFLCSLFLLTSFTIINMLILMAMLKKENMFHLNKYESILKESNEIENNFNILMNEIVFKMEYRNPLLNLNLLSKKTGIPQNRISMIINEKTGKNFNELINERRIDDAKRMMMQKKGDHKILEIAYEVGFNSKSTFNTAFKKYTGLTPTEFKLKNG